MYLWNSVISICLFSSAVLSKELSNKSFPDNFIFGVGTSAYQIEGGWNKGGRGESIWDYDLHTNPDLVEDGSNGDIACDSYHKWQEDVQISKDLGVNFYRFSVSWTRILPLGYANSKVNQEGVKYYSDLIDALLAAGLEPYITIYHWDLPQTLQRKGGWLNETIVDDYVYYATMLFQLYGDRVKHWTTFNEFMQFCEPGYSEGSRPPLVKRPGVGGYLCFHHAIIAHGHTYKIYNEKFRSTQKGQVGVTADTIWCEPKTDSEADQAASEQCMQFNYGWFIHPIFIGNYPPIMIERIAALSKLQGYSKSRLPVFTDEQIELIKNSVDFLGLNHYSSSYATFSGNDTQMQPSFTSDTGVVTTPVPGPITSAATWIKYTPWALTKLLVWINKQYNNPPVLITENGWANAGMELDDTQRRIYFKGYLSAVLDAIYENGCNVFGYSPWSLMDNFEWINGYTLKFGLVYVDFDSPNKTRTPRSSYRMFQNITSERRLI